MKIERECTGYKYTGATDDNRENWQVETDYINGKIYYTSPDEDADLKEARAFGRAIVHAVADMKREMNDNRFDV